MLMAEWMSSLALPHDKTLRDTKDQLMPALSVVLHITGRATYINAEKRKKPPLEHLGEYFDRTGNPFAHYSVDPWGRIACHADEQQTPYAQGWSAYGGPAGLQARLDKGKLTIWPWWLERWGAVPSRRRPGCLCETPFDLLDPSQPTPNARSVAIEFIQYDRQLRLTDI
jgi:hypothetical protein